jgi:dihydroorotate dehydrogenase
MYKALIRPLFFLMDPEKAHHLVVLLVKIITSVPGVNSLLRKLLTYRHSLLKTTVAGLTFENKIGLAAGFDKNADFYNEFTAFGFSFIEIGTVTPVAQPGNPRPRLFRLPKDRALINRMGFNNKGVAYAANQLKNRKQNVIIGGNIGKNTVTLNQNASEDYLKCFRVLYDCVDYFAVNVSCPNIKDLDKLQDTDSLRDILNILVRERSKRSIFRPLFLKISPDLTFKQLDETIALVLEVGLDGIIATNTTTDRTCLTSDIHTGPGGLSGLPLKQRSLEMVRYICKQVDGRIPVIGVGGIITPQDAVDMIAAGASLVQVYTGFIYDGPMIVRKSNRAIAKYLEAVTEKPYHAYV